MLPACLRPAEYDHAAQTRTHLQQATRAAGRRSIRLDFTSLRCMHENKMLLYLSNLITASAARQINLRTMCVYSQRILGSQNKLQAVQ